MYNADLKPLADALRAGDAYSQQRSFDARQEVDRERADLKRGLVGEMRQLVDRARAGDMGLGQRTKDLKARFDGLARRFRGVSPESVSIA